MQKQMFCGEVAFGQSADSSTTLHSRFPGLHIVCMKQASTFDVQLSPGCPWCGQVGYQVWCNEAAMEKSRLSTAGPAGAGAHSRSPLQMCSQRILGVWLLFWLWLSLLLFLLGLYETVPVSDSCLGHHPLNPSTLVNA